MSPTADAATDTGDRFAGTVKDPATIGLSALNALSTSEAEAALLRCCGSARWARLMAAVRPFHTIAALTDAAADVWQALSAADWQQAFEAHPRIGASGNASGSAATAWSAEEQAGTTKAGISERRELERLNDEYEARFSHRFIVCATGLAVGEMLSKLRTRMANPPAAELAIAVAEQARITELRFHKLLARLAEA